MVNEYIVTTPTPQKGRRVILRDHYTYNKINAQHTYFVTITLYLFV